MSKAPAGATALPDPAHLSSLRAAIVGWFARGHRDLPWRRTRDPYAIWVSEIMLQQTRVETVTPRFERWMARFPSARALAEAPLDDVLAEWAGLGYYARARNLHQAAKQVATEYGGRVPDTEEAIRSLPGVGRYTAGAILSIAYGRAAPILDGNVERVLARLFRVAGDPKGREASGRLWALATALVALPQHGNTATQQNIAASHNAALVGKQPGKGEAPPEPLSPSHLNQGLMELGAVICSPRRPACLACPVEKMCQARRAGEAERFPEKGRATKVLAVEQVAVALLREGKVLLARRPPEGLWGGLFELPSGEVQTGESPIAAARRVAAERVGLDIEVAAIAPLPPPGDRFEHLLSHRKMTFYGVKAEASTGRVKRSFYDAHQWVAPARAGTLGISRATVRLLEALDGKPHPRRS